MKMKKVKNPVIWLIVVLLTGSTGLWARGAQEADVARTPPDTLVVAFPQDILTFDPTVITAMPEEPRMMVFEQLYYVDERLVPQPHLAKSFELSEDELTWTFHLREDVIFHDGQQMTSADVIASWGRFVEVGALARDFVNVEEVVAVDDFTVEFRLNSRFGQLLQNLGGGGGGTFAVFPEWVVNEIGTDDLVERRHLVGTGPYTVDEIVPEERYLLRRFDGYNQPGGEPSFLAGNRYAPVEFVEIRVIPDPATRVAALEAGDVDLIQYVPLDDAKRLDANPNTYVKVTSPGQRIYYKFNVNRGPFTDPLLREAVRMAIDPEALMLAVGDPEYTRVNHSMRYQEEQWMWSDVAWDYYKNDIDRARELVSQSSYDGELIVFLTTPGRTVEFRTAVPMEQTLRDLGLNVEMRAVDGASWSVVRRDLDEWNIKHAGGGSVSGPMALDFSVRDRTGAYWPGVPDEWKELMEIIAAEASQDAIGAAIQRLHELHAEMNYELWIGEALELAGARNYVTNVPPWYKLVLWNIEKE